MTEVYLLDDHALVREGLRAVLEQAGLLVVGESDDPTLAIAELLRLRPQVLLLDLKLGQRCGLDLLKRLHARQPETRTVVLTMSEQPHDVAQALRLGAQGYVLKGSPASEVVAAVQTVARGQPYLAARVVGLAQHHQSHSDGLAELSARERQVLLGVVRGQTSAAIALQQHLSAKTVDSYRSRLMLKLGVGDVPALVRLAIRQGLISADEH
jgi:two-component system, NarL family, invasion response regulator UvrY